MSRKRTREQPVLVVYSKDLYDLLYSESNNSQSKTIQDEDFVRILRYYQDKYQSLNEEYGFIQKKLQERISERSQKLKAEEEIQSIERQFNLDSSKLDHDS